MDAFQIVVDLTSTSSIQYGDASPPQARRVLRHRGQNRRQQVGIKTKNTGKIGWPKRKRDNRGSESCATTGKMPTKKNEFEIVCKGRKRPLKKTDRFESHAKTGIQIRRRVYPNHLGTRTKYGLTHLAPECCRLWHISFEVQLFCASGRSYRSYRSWYIYPSIYLQQQTIYSSSFTCCYEILSGICHEVQI